MTDTPFTPALDHEESAMLTKEERAELLHFCKAAEKCKSYPALREVEQKAALIVPNAVPRLLDALDQAEQRIAELEAIIEETEREEARDNGQFGVGA